MSTTKKARNTGPALQHLGGLSAATFLRRYWQKKPLLIRRAFPGFQDPLTSKEVLTLATRHEAESRLVLREGDRWTLQQGPMHRRELKRNRADLWTVLVQDTQHFSHESQALLAEFSFIPHARVDDLMVSYAVPGAGVGPHIDSYDVFLIQGEGRRRWRISSQADLRLKSGLPLKILAHFQPEQEYLLETGDVLYLPPGYAHDGVAETECLTWSVGFRAPSQQELATAYLDFLRDSISLSRPFRDPDLAATQHPGLMDTHLLRRFSVLLDDVLRASADHRRQAQFLGCFLTEPKSHVFFDPPEYALTQGQFRTSALKRGVVLDLKSRFLYQKGAFFLNGCELQIARPDFAVFRQLADKRRVRIGTSERGCSKAGLASLYQAYLDGYLQFDSSNAS